MAISNYLVPPTRQATGKSKVSKTWFLPSKNMQYCEAAYIEIAKAMPWGNCVEEGSLEEVRLWEGYLAWRILAWEVVSSRDDGPEKISWTIALK